MIEVHIKRRWIAHWAEAAMRYKPQAFAVGKGDPTKVDHLFSTGTEDGRRCFAFASAEERDRYVAEAPETFPCTVFGYAVVGRPE